MVLARYYHTGEELLVRYYHAGQQVLARYHHTGQQVLARYYHAGQQVHALQSREGAWNCADCPQPRNEQLRWRHLLTASY